MIGVPLTGSQRFRRAKQLQRKVQGRGQDFAYFQERQRPRRQGATHPGRHGFHRSPQGDLFSELPHVHWLSFFDLKYLEDSEAP